MMSSLERRLAAIIAADPWRMHLLETVRRLNLSDWWIGAGFVRNGVWDHLHDNERGTPLNDIDVIYFDRTNQTYEHDRKFEEQLKQREPKAPWSVKNQARMHAKNGFPPFNSSTDALSHWTETATAVAVCLNAKGEVTIAAPYGLDDLFRCIAGPTPYFADKPEIWQQRVQQKQWQTLWPKVSLRA